ncbi:hypothetical protein [Paratissierella segnis]|jgi:ribosomal protein S18 acetylase RimI-like enzyme|uniref:N-acetyltransferase domain-containing protein n=1 Tax=Paratissierella segnis TaxID=2763679 RepID=A0A926EV96_9FIRM|nr:hypothetical protein [Paratissierella segnis]MBC8587197.1 hypothetical protein [Paratissierella segnis]
MLLTTGYLIKDKYNTRKREEYTIELIPKANLNEVIDLQLEVYEGIDNKEILYLDSYDEMYEDLKNGAKVIGVRNNRGKLISYRYIGFPGKDSRNLGYDINLPKDELDSVVHLETTVVKPIYRGNNLQSLTLEIATELVKEEGYKHLLCTVSPYNFFSLYNVMKNGLKIKKLKKKYARTENEEGMWRFILHRDLKNPYSNPVDLVVSKWANLEKQKELIEDGYIGFEIFKDTRLLNYMKFEN